MLRRLQITALLALLIGVLWQLQRCSHDDPPRGTEPPASKTSTKKKEPEQHSTAGQKEIMGESRATSDAIDRRLGTVLAQLRPDAGQTEAVRRRTLQNTAQYLTDLPPRAAAAAILRRLESGEDAETGLLFRPGENGLDGWPTWRVYLLDLLGVINPKLAAEYARRSVFVKFDSADEWAIAMRSVVAAAAPSQQTAMQAELSRLLGRMLGHQAWRAQPSAGMFEAMDFVAHASDPVAHVATLQAWAAEQNNGLVDGALQLTAERTALRQTQGLLEALVTDPGLLASTPAQRALRASLMARADLRQPEQAAALRSYLARLPADSEEALALFALFPNHRFGVSPGLASLPLLPTAAEMRAADAAASNLIPVWMADPSLAAHAASLEGLRDKIAAMLQNE